MAFLQKQRLTNLQTYKPTNLQTLARETALDPSLVLLHQIKHFSKQSQILYINHLFKDSFMHQNLSKIIFFFFYHSKNLSKVTCIYQQLSKNQFLYMTHLSKTTSVSARTVTWGVILSGPTGMDADSTGACWWPFGGDSFLQIISILSAAQQALQLPSTLPAVPSQSTLLWNHTIITQHPSAKQLFFNINE